MSSMEPSSTFRRRDETPLSWPYVRTADGTWAYVWGGVVPGARDCTIGDLYGLSPTVVDGREVVEVPVSLWVDDRRLSWVAAYRDPRDRGDTIRVPLAAWRSHDEVVTLMAPELLAGELLDTTAVARLYGCSPRAISNYLTRELVPPPVARIGGSPVWTRPQIQQALAERPGRGRRRRLREGLPR